jgi:small conductance mechanosensitive channel
MDEGVASWGQIAESVALRIGLTIVAIALTWAVNRVAQWLVSVPLEQAVGRRTTITSRIETIQSLVGSLVKYAIFIVAFLVILAEVWEVDTSSLVVGTAVLGAALGFGSQGLVQDIVTGLSLLVENQLNVGQRVEIAGKKGKVLAIGLRAVKIQGDDGAVHLIFNRTISSVTMFAPDQ